MACWKHVVGRWLGYHLDIRPHGRRADVNPYIIVHKERPIDIPYITHTAIQNRPYLDKFESPEALDRCIRILSARSSFLAWFSRISPKFLDIDRLHCRIARYWRAATQNC